MEFRTHSKLRELLCFMRNQSRVSGRDGSPVKVLAGVIPRLRPNAHLLAAPVLALAFLAPSASYALQFSADQCSGKMPSRYEVIVYVDSYFGGGCSVVQLGQYPTAQSFQMDNDQVSSIRVGASVKATLFQDNWYGGRSEVIYFDAPRLTNNLIGNDALSSIIVEPNGWSACTSPPPYPYTQYLPAAYCRREPLAEEVIVYRDAYFGGDCAINRPGNYEHGSSFSMPNDSVSSIKVGSGVKATLYSDAYFNGREQTLSAPGSDRLSIQFIGNDTASSLKVRRTCN